LSLNAREYYQSLADGDKKVDDGIGGCEEPYRMWTRKPENSVRVNWLVVFSYCASTIVSLAIWMGVYRAVEHLIK
jgi:hypothetical protein